MNLHITKSKNAESFYICRSYAKDNGSTTSTIVRKLGTLENLLIEHGPTRDDVIAWAKNEVKAETEKYKKEKEAKTLLIPFHTDRPLDYDKQVFFRGGYLFPQSVYYQLQMNKVCRKLKQKYKFKYDINAILSDLIYTRILDPCSKRSSFRTAHEFLEKPSYELHDVYRALDVLGSECDLIQADVYKNSHFLEKRNDKIFYCDCSNYYFEIEQEDGIKKYGKSKEHRPNPIIQMGLFMDGDGIPLAFFLFSGNSNEQTSLKPLEQKILEDFECQKFIYCSDAGLESESIWEGIMACAALKTLHQFFCKKIKLYFERLLSNKDENPVVFQIKEYLHHNYAVPSLSVPDISEHVHLSPAYVCTLFKSETGQTLNQYLTDYRIKMSKQFLSDPLYKITDISAKVGYSDGNYYSKAFRKIVGLSPSEYREKML